MGMLSIAKSIGSVFDCMPLFFRRSSHIIKRLTNTSTVVGIALNRNSSTLKNNSQLTTNN